MQTVPSQPTTLSQMGTMGGDLGCVGVPSMLDSPDTAPQISSKPGRFLQGANGGAGDLRNIGVASRTQADSTAIWLHSFTESLICNSAFLPCSQRLWAIWAELRRFVGFGKNSKKSIRDTHWKIIWIGCHSRISRMPKELPRPTRGLIHWCKTVRSRLIVFSCNARRVHTLGSASVIRRCLLNVRIARKRTSIRAV
jgi:hypothetical protein